MSILNVCRSSDERVLVAVDTRGYVFERGQPVEIAKMLVLPHMAGVVAGRGRTGYLSNVAFNVHTDGGDFDDLRFRMRDIMEHSERQLIQQGAKLLADEGQQVVLVGYSREVGRLGCAQWIRPARGAAIVFSEISGTLSPWDSAMGTPPADWGGTDETMLAAARRQVAHWAPRAPTFGGRLIVAEVLAPKGGRPSVTVRDLAEL